MGSFAGSAVGKKSDDEENCEEESSNHEHHEKNLEPPRVGVVDTHMRSRATRL
jgi:hypothetical protein